MLYCNNRALFIARSNFSNEIIDYTYSNFMFYKLFTREEYESTDYRKLNDSEFSIIPSEEVDEVHVQSFTPNFIKSMLMKNLRIFLPKYKGEKPPTCFYGLHLRNIYFKLRRGNNHVAYSAKELLVGNEKVVCMSRNIQKVDNPHLRA